MWKNTGTNATVGGEFTNGDPGLGDPRSILGADWLNMMQRELQNLVTGAGLALNAGNQSQVLAAVIALAASSGFTTGDGKLTLKTAADAGWVMANDGTLSKAGSGGTARANADTQALYTLIWNNVSNTHAPVSGGRGANAAADFAAGKTIALTKQLGRAIAVAGGGAGLTARTLGSVVGEETHTLDISEIPQIDVSNGAFSKLLAEDDEGTQTDVDTNFGGTEPNITNCAEVSKPGGGQAHNNMQPTAFWNVMIKL